MFWWAVVIFRVMWRGHGIYMYASGCGLDWWKCLCEYGDDAKKQNILSMTCVILYHKTTACAFVKLIKYCMEDNFQIFMVLYGYGTILAPYMYFRIVICRVYNHCKLQLLHNCELQCVKMGCIYILITGPGFAMHSGHALWSGDKTLSLIPFSIV